MSRFIHFYMTADNHVLRNVMSPLLGTRVAMPDRLLRRAGIVDSFEREGDFDEFFS